ncbi:MAG: HEPN domain-containing protein [Deltaproteobacteria bacterium]|nr:HEPN domain-containing protein [Deltaproteobacteria bacterium]
MTEGNKKDNIKIQLEKASEILKEANLLFENNLVRGAVSRLYYYLLHTVRALLLTKGLEPKSHEGVLRVFGQYFIREGILEARFSHIFARLMKYREEADYNPAYVVSKDDFVEFRKEAEVMCDKINSYLKQKGYA